MGFKGGQDTESDRERKWGSEVGKIETATERERKREWLLRGGQDKARILMHSFTFKPLPLKKGVQLGERVCILCGGMHACLPTRLHACATDAQLQLRSWQIVSCSRECAFCVVACMLACQPDFTHAPQMRSSSFVLGK